MQQKAAIIGGGVIGGGWAARFLLNGWDVAIFDPAPHAKTRIDQLCAHARRSLPSLYDRPLPSEGELHFCATLDDTVKDADWIQESVPERLEIKHDILGKIHQFAPEHAIIGSSTSGFKPSQLNEKGGRTIVAHPFNPVYLLPLIELVGDQEQTQNAAQILSALGMYPLALRKEIDAHIADRLLEAVWREALWLIRDGIASTAEIDEAIRMGFGLRWAQMGLFETYRIAGGSAGMRHFLAQFGPALAWPWTKLMDVPDLDETLIEKIATQSDEQSGHLSIEALEAKRDDNLVGILRALKKNGNGAGAVIAAHEQNLSIPQKDGLPVTLDQQVPQSWTDYNGHMNEAHYLEVGAAATDRFMEMIGADAAYIADGMSFFTAENHIRYLHEAKAGERIYVTSQLLNGRGKKLHLFHRIYRGDGVELATMESFLLHVDLTTRKTCDPAPSLRAKLERFATEQAHLPYPEGAGSAIRAPS